jgi:hypothetical protein
MSDCSQAGGNLRITQDCNHCHNYLNSRRSGSSDDPLPSVMLSAVANLRDMFEKRQSPYKPILDINVEL